MDRLLDMRMQSGVTFDHLASVYEQYTGQDRGREPATELADFFERFPEDAVAARGEAR